MKGPTQEENSVTRALSATRPVPRRGRSEAAMYIGVSTSAFDKPVAEEVMPGPIAIGSRRVWDIRAIDLAFDKLADVPKAPKKNSWADRWATRQPQPGSS